MADFPKWVYHKHSTPTRVIKQQVHTAEEQAALGREWVEDIRVLQLQDESAKPATTH